MLTLSHGVYLALALFTRHCTHLCCLVRRSIVSYVKQVPRDVHTIQSKRLQLIDDRVKILIEKLDETRSVVDKLLTKTKIMGDTIAHMNAGLPKKERVYDPNASRVSVVMSTMRRGLAQEPIFKTVESLIPHLGLEGSIETTLVIVDVENGRGDFGKLLQQHYASLVSAGLIRIIHLDDESRELLYTNLVDTCSLHRLYNDELNRIIWRSKRVLDFIFSLRISAKESDYILVLEDDTPVLGDYPFSIQQCLDKYSDTQTACRWDFHWSLKKAQGKVHKPNAPQALVEAKLMYPQGNLQGVFALMLPTPTWLEMSNWMRTHFDKAPADWLIGRWLFLQNWRIAFMPPTMAIYHNSDASFKDSSRIAVRRKIKDDALFADKAFEWSACFATKQEHASHPFKWDRGISVRWVGGEDFWIEVSHFDIEGHDIGIAKEAALMDNDAKIIVCEKTPGCAAINKMGWMKGVLSEANLSKPNPKFTLYVRVAANANAEQENAIRTFYHTTRQKMVKPNRVGSQRRVPGKNANGATRIAVVNQRDVRKPGGAPRRRV